MTKYRIITLNSLIHIKDIDSGEVFHFNLVASLDKNTHGEQLSIHSPLGVILSGRKTGEIIHWNGPSRQRRFYITFVR